MYVCVCAIAPKSRSQGSIGGGVGDPGAPGKYHNILSTNLKVAFIADFHISTHITNFNSHGAPPPPALAKRTPPPPPSFESTQYFFIVTQARGGIFYVTRKLTPRMSIWHSE